MGIEEPGLSNRQGGLIERKSIDDLIAKSSGIDINGGAFSRDEGGGDKERENMWKT